MIDDFEVSSLRHSVLEYCEKIGLDSMLVQGAGGNVSWKDNGTLWVKASGKWLADAKKENIFVPVDLSCMQKSICSGDFKATPKITDGSSLRPSIETMLHALMPHKVVVHIHAVEILTHLVQQDSILDFDETIRWFCVDYYKPGEELAEAVYKVTKDEQYVDAILLKNHGVVIGADTVENVDEILQLMIKSSISVVCDSEFKSIPHTTLENIGGQKYLPAEDDEVHQLALNSKLYSRLSSEWALYPDHIVFLGEKPFTYNAYEDFVRFSEGADIVFIRDFGVFLNESCSSAKKEQLRCYYDVLSRLPIDAILNSLTLKDISNLLNWDAEKYRKENEK